MKKTGILLALGFLIFLSGCAARQIAPGPLPHVKAEFESAGFWLQGLSGPKTTILNPEQIRDANRKALSGGANLVDIFSADLWHRTYIVRIFSALRGQYGESTFYDQANRPVPPAYFERVFSEMAEEKIPEKIEPVFGLIARTTDLRELPTEGILMRSPDDIAFDVLQYARIECGTPVAILHSTVNRDWCLVQTSFAAGWVRTLDLAVGTRESIMRFAEEQAIVVTGEHAEVYLDPDFIRFAAALPMGARLPYLDGSGDFYRVMLPGRGDDGRLRMLTGYVKATEDVRIGFLPYTMENVLRQAFKLYGQPYGWGGLFGGRDCSRFIRDIFRTFGFNMPANSLRQANFTMTSKRDISRLQPREKTKLLKQYRGKPVLLYMKGHIMLFLGVMDDRVYAIHSTWAYRDRTFFKNTIHRIGGVVVSDLSLGEGGERGSLLDRLRVITPME